MLTHQDILLGLALPAMVCAGVLLAAWQPWRRASARDGRWAGAIAIGAAYAIAYARLVGDFHFPPTDSDDWIAYVMPVAMVVGVLFCRLPRAPWVRLATVEAIALALIWLLVRPLIGNEFSGMAAAGRIGAGSVAMTLWWVAVNQLARSGPRVMTPVILFLAAAGGAVVLGDNGLAQRGGVTLGALAVILAASAAVAAVTSRFSLAGGGTLATTLVLFGTMLYGYYYIYPDPTPRLITAMAIVLVAPMLAWIGWLPPLRRGPSWVRASFAVALVLLGVAAAVVVAESASRQPAAGETDTP